MVCIGDGVARDTIHRLLEQGEAEWLTHAPAGNEASDDQERIWTRLSERLRAAPSPEDAGTALGSEEQTYHVLVRSCAAPARFAILVATYRLIDCGLNGDVIREKLPAPELDHPEPWMRCQRRSRALPDPMPSMYRCRWCPNRMLSALSGAIPVWI
jgi:hypothetical protein